MKKILNILILLCLTGGGLQARGLITNGTQDRLYFFLANPGYCVVLEPYCSIDVHSCNQFKVKLIEQSHPTMLLCRDSLSNGIIPHKEQNVMSFLSCLMRRDLIITIDRTGHFNFNWKTGNVRLSSSCVRPFHNP